MQCDGVALEGQLAGKELVGIVLGAYIISFNLQNKWLQGKC